jgi:RNA polymerase sigma-70 factor (ECF subfamily)
MDPIMSYFSRLKRLLRSRGRTKDDAEELIQDAFLRMQTYCNQGRKVREPEAFLVRTVLRLDSNARRYTRRHPRSEQALEDLILLDTSPSPEEILQAEQSLRRMRERLDRVSRPLREVFFMHRLDGLSRAEIAERFGVSVSTVEKQIASALAILMEEMYRK